jgi:hypothetical protein
VCPDSVTRRVNQLLKQSSGACFRLGDKLPKSLGNNRASLFIILHPHILFPNKLLTSRNITQLIRNLYFPNAPPLGKAASSRKSPFHFTHKGRRDWTQIIPLSSGIIRGGGVATCRDGRVGAAYPHA